MDKFGTILNCFIVTPSIEVLIAACDYNVSVGLESAALLAP
jgi:hypothetical protein